MSRKIFLGIVLYILSIQISVGQSFENTCDEKEIHEICEALNYQIQQDLNVAKVISQKLQDIIKGCRQVSDSTYAKYVITLSSFFREIERIDKADSLHLIASQKLNDRSHSHYQVLLEFNNVLFQKKDYQTIDSISNLCDIYFKEIDSTSYFKNLVMIGKVRYYTAQEDESIDHLLNALRYFEGKENKKMLAQVQNELGLNYRGQAINTKNFDQLDKALKYFKKALKINEELKDQISVLKNLQNIVGTFGMNQQIDSSKVYIKKALQIAKNTNSKKYQKYISVDYGSVLLSEKRYSEALIQYLKAENLFGDDYPPGTKLNIGMTYEALGQYEEALRYLNESRENAIRSNYRRLEEAAQKSIINVYTKRKDYKSAYEFQLQRQYLRDSIINEEKVKSIAALETKYESEKKEQEILLLKKDQELKRALIDKQGSLLLGGGFGILGCMFGFFYLIRARRKEQELLQKDIALLKKENKEWSEKVQRYRATKQKIAIRQDDVIKINGVGPIIPLVDLKYVQSHGNYVKIFTKAAEKPILLRYPLSKFLEEYLPLNLFARINNRTVINLNYIIRKKAAAIYIQDNGKEKEFKVGRTFKENFQAKYDELPDSNKNVF